MIKMNFSDYRLVYYRISDGKKFLVRRVSNAEYVLLDPEKNLKSRVNYRQLKNEFVADNFQNNETLKALLGVRLC